MKLLAMILSLAAMPAIAGVPPEVPSSRTTQIFSPYFFGLGDDGESVFTSQGPPSLGYNVILDRRQTDAPRHGFVATAGLPAFLEELQQTSGLQFISSHGDPGHLLVEVFGAGLEGQNDANNQFNAYLNNQALLSSAEAIVQDTNGDGSGYWGIWVSAAYINRVLGATNAQHSLVHNSSCDSFTLASSFAGANIRGYFGYTDICPVHTGDAGTIFNTMSGVLPINDSFQNFTARTAYLTAKAHTQILSFQPNTPSANGIRLYLAPRIVFSDVSQDVAGDNSYSNSLYHYQFDSSYPYNDGTDFPGALGTPGLAKNGQIRINLRFSEPMDSNWSEFKVQLRFLDGTTQDISGNWGSSVLANDNWSATANLPSNAPDGNVTVAIRAKKIQSGSGLDTGVQELDLDGDGQSTAGTWDTRISLSIADPYFLVENEKLIFSVLAGKTHENWGSRSFYIGRGNAPKRRISLVVWA